MKTEYKFKDRYCMCITAIQDVRHCKGSSVGEWLGHSFAVLGVDGLSLLTASRRCDGLNSPYAKTPVTLRPGLNNNE